MHAISVIVAAIEALQSVIHILQVRGIIEEGTANVVVTVRVGLVDEGIVGHLVCEFVADAIATLRRRSTEV